MRRGEIGVYILPVAVPADARPLSPVLQANDVLSPPEGPRGFRT